MKKFLALIIALVMALSLVACGEQKQPETPDVPDDGGDQQQTATIKVASSPCTMRTPPTT